MPEKFQILGSEVFVAWACIAYIGIMREYRKYGTEARGNEKQ